MLFATLAAASLVAVPVAASASPVPVSVPLSATAAGEPAAVYPSVWEGGAPIIDPGPVSVSRAGRLGYDPATDAAALGLGLAAGTPQAGWAPEAGSTEQLPFGTTLVAGIDRYVRPVPGPITSAFGPRFHPILHYVRNHNGADMTAACGVPVVAMADGSVTRAGRAGGYGNLVELNHGTLDADQVTSRYAHLSVIGVAVGDKVGRGQVIGLAGTTGLSTACHLHFEVLINGSYVDPAGVLAGAPFAELIGMSRSIKPSQTPVVPPVVPPSGKAPSTPSGTPTPSTPPKAGATPSPTPTPTPTPKPTAPSSPAPQPTPSATAAPAPSAPVTLAPRPSASPTPTAEPTPTPEPSPTPTQDPEPAPSPSAEPTQAPEPTAAPAPTASSSPSAAPNDSAEPSGGVTTARPPTVG